MERVDYGLLEFAVIDCVEDMHYRFEVQQELDEYFGGNKAHKDLSDNARNVLSRYEFLRVGEEKEEEYRGEKGQRGQERKGKNPTRVAGRSGKTRGEHRTGECPE